MYKLHLIIFKYIKSNEFLYYKNIWIFTFLLIPQFWIF